MTNHPNRPTREGWDLHPISPQELRELIEAAGITQADAARRCHASERTMRQWLAGDRSIPLTASEALALSLMWPGVTRRVQPSLSLVERWLRPQFAGLILSLRVTAQQPCAARSRAASTTRPFADPRQPRPSSRRG